MVSFFRRHMGGEVGEDAIHDHIDTWHRGDSAEPLFSYLGLTDCEYGAWVEDPSCLPQLVKERRMRDATQQPRPTSRRTTGGKVETDGEGEDGVSDDKTGATCPKCQQPADVAEGLRDKNPWGPMRWSIHCRPCGLEVIGDFRGEVERKWAGFHEDVRNGREPTPGRA